MQFILKILCVLYIKGSFDIQLDFKIIGFHRFRRSAPEGQI